MEIDRAQRAAARHKKTEAVESILSTQKDEAVHSHQEGNKTLWRSGVVVRNDRNVGHEAMQRARELLNSVNGPILSKQRTAIGTNDTWFEEHKFSVEQQIGEEINVQAPHLQRDKKPEFKHMPVEHYQPPVDDDAEIYIPISER